MLYLIYKGDYGGVKDINDLGLDDPIYMEKPMNTSKDEDLPTHMRPDEPGMRQCFPSGSALLNQVTFGLSIITGLWWLIWLILFGQDYENFWSIIGFFTFFISELINFVLGAVYQVNFLRPVSRRWKSLNHLENFTIIPQADSMIFHYTESVETTSETIMGCLKMDRLNKVQSDVYVCDDGFWRKHVIQDDPFLMPLPRKKKSKCGLCISIKDQIFGCMACCGHNNNKSSSSSSSNLIEMNDKVEEERKRYFDLGGEIDPIKFIPAEDALEFIQKNYNVIPTDKAKELMEIIPITLQNFACEETPGSKIDDFIVKFVCTLTILAEKGGGKDGFGLISRRDCAVASLKYEYRVFHKDDDISNENYNNNSKWPSVFIVARVKPPKHHYKAGNINNCLYNEMDKSNGNRFVCFFDNDMIPQQSFLMRTLPFFYNGRFSQQSNSTVYDLNTLVSFIQTPQHFTTDTLAPVLDYLASKNSIFFQAIQKGRDGFNSCAFAGTNAVFRVGALYGIGGMPYGSVTEDALAGRYLHKAGYRSIYAEQILAIGEAPTTVASAMKQRMRWCKVKYY